MKKSSHLFFLLLFAGLISSSCSDNYPNDKDSYLSGIFMDRIFYVEYVNADETNVLQNDSQIEVFYEKDGTKQKVSRSYLDYPNGFTLTSQRNTSPTGSDELCVQVFPSDYMDNENISTTLIKFGNVQTDTFQCQFEVTPHALYLTNIWLNGNLVWDIQTALSRPLIQIKM